MSHPRGEDASKTPKDEQRTPPALFKALDDRFHFQVDVAATEDNTLCPGYYTKEDDALKQEWVRDDYDENDVVIPGGIRRFWCNPPYSLGMADKFLMKGCFESMRNGAVVVFLISSDVSPAYYDWCMLAAEWIRIKGRVEFLHEDGTPIKGSAMFGSMAIVFDYAQWEKQGRVPIVTQLEWK